MALTEAERREMAQLESELGQAKPKAQASSRLTPEEQAEMAQLEQDVGQHPAKPPGMLDRFKHLFSPEAKQEAQAIEQQRAAELERQKAAGTSLLQTELEQTGNALTLGYLPQIQAGAASLAGDDYVTARDANIKRLEAQAEEHPMPALAGNVAGTVGTVYAMPAGVVTKGGGLVKGAAKLAGISAAQGFVQNPGDTEGVVDPIQMDERLENAKSGAKTGLIVGGAAGAGQAVAKKASEIGAKMKGAAEGVAFKSAGAMLKDFRASAGKNEVNKLGRFMMDEGMTKAGDTVETVAEKAATINKEAGKKLDTIYNQATKTAGQAAETMPGLSLANDKEEILSQVSKALGNSEGKAATLRRVEAYLDERAAEHGVKVLSPRIANDIKGSADELINYSRNPLTKEPNVEKAFSTVRKYIEDKVHSQVEHLGRLAGREGLGAELRATNARYGMSKRIEGIAKDKLNRLSANNTFGLTDRIAGGAAGVAAGVASAGADIAKDGSLDDPLAALAYGTGAGLLGAAGNHVVGRYGTSTMSKGLDGTGGLLRAAGKAGHALTPAPGLAARVAVGQNRKGRKGKLDDPRGLIPLSDKDTP